MTRKEKIEYIYELAAGEDAIYYALFSVEELKTMINILNPKGQHPDAAMSAEDSKTILDIERRYCERLEQLTPCELDAVKKYANNNWDWEIEERVKVIQKRLGIQYG